MVKVAVIAHPEISSLSSVECLDSQCIGSQALTRRTILAVSRELESQNAWTGQAEGTAAGKKQGVFLFTTERKGK